MRYLSLFSGVEMASLAFKPLGWELVAVAEVDPFASAVIAHHHPGVPNLGDVSKVAEERVFGLGPIDLVVGGFPCQDLSVAGKRKGLKHDDGTVTRSGLFFDAMRLVRASGCRWLVIENVPGLFSSPPGNQGADFGAVLTEIVGCSFAIPRDGWQAAGAATGPRGAVCWRTLDAQWFGVAQRRERVFIVADFGARADTAPLFPLLESVPRDPPACVAARTRPARRPARSVGRKSIWQQIAEAFSQGQEARPTQVAGALDTCSGRPDDNDAQAGRLIPEVAGTLGNNGKAAGTATTQDAAAGLLLPVDGFASATEFLPQSSRVYSEDETAPALQATGTRMGNHTPQIAVRPLAYGGNDTRGPIDVATALNAHGGPMGRMDFESETFVAEVTPLLASGAHGANGLGIGQPGDPAMTLDSTGAQAIAFSCKDDGRDAAVDIAPTMRSMSFDKSHANAGGQLAVCINGRQDPQHYGDLAGTIGNQDSGLDNVVGIPFDTTQITSNENRASPRAGDPCHALASQAKPPAYATLLEVRRLMPVECCRLQGVPDDYFDFLYKGKPPADGPVYKCLGNGWAVPVMAWIGRRIEAAIAAEARI